MFGQGHAGTGGGLYIPRALFEFNMPQLSKFSVPLLLGCFFLFLLASCKKEAETLKTVTDTSALSTQKAVYAPFELVAIKTPKNALGTQALDALLDGQKVRLVATDTLAVFVLPDVANGDHTLTLTANGKDYALKVGVRALTNVLAPEVYFTALEAGTTRNLATINAQADALQLGGGPTAEVQALKHNAQQYATQLATYKTTYQGLSAAEKQDFARAMAANKAADDEYEGLTAAFASQASALRGLQAVSNYEAGVDASMKAFAGLVIHTVAHIPSILLTANLVVLLPDPFTKAAALVALGITLNSFLVHITLTRSAVGILLSKALKPALGLDVDQTSYDDGTDVAVNVSAQYRSLVQADETSGAGGSILDAGLARYNQFRDAFNDLVGKLPSVLRPTPIVTVLKAQATNLSRSIYNSYVRISNISNSAVTLLLLNQADGSLKVRATTTATTTQTFTYDLMYMNSGFSTGLTKRVSAQVVVTSCRLSAAQVQFLTGGSSKTWRLTQEVEDDRGRNTYDIFIGTASAPILFVYNINGQYTGENPCFDYTTHTMIHCGPPQTISEPFCPYFPIDDIIFLSSNSYGNRLISLTANRLVVQKTDYATFPNPIIATYTLVSP